MGWKNFHIWRGRLPHWRAEDVSYFVTFRHRRELEEAERLILFRQLMRPDGKKWDLLVLGVLPGETQMIFRVREVASRGVPYELADIVEPAKRKAGNQIIKKSGERFPPFYQESFDRIIRDDTELEERWLAIVEMPARQELCGESEDWDTLWVAGSV